MLRLNRKTRFKRPKRRRNSLVLSQDSGDRRPPRLACCCSGCMTCHESGLLNHIHFEGRGFRGRGRPHVSYVSMGAVRIVHVRISSDNFVFLLGRLTSAGAHDSCSAKTTTPAGATPHRGELRSSQEPWVRTHTLPCTGTEFTRERIQQTSLVTDSTMSVSCIILHKVGPTCLLVGYL